jgi:hypothetical protein
MRASTVCFVAGAALALILGSALVAQGGWFGGTTEVEMNSAEAWDSPETEEAPADDARATPTPGQGPEDWMLRYGFPLAAGLIVAGAVLRLADLRRAGP